MKSKALIVGAEVGGLTGVHTDVEVMSDVMSRRGFDVTRCENADATCEGILAAYEKLITDVGRGDRALVYFSGHGAYLRSVESRMQADIQAIVPFDYSASTPTDVRAITDLQMSVLQARLTERTDNCTVILDCCHSAHMSRDGDLVVKARAYPTYVDVVEHNKRIPQNGFRVGLAPALSNTKSIRVVACAPYQSAYEYTTRSGARMGLATESLILALQEAGDTPVTWSALMQRIRSRVLLLSPGQRPEVEGPSDRLLFDTTTVEAADAWPAVPSGPTRVSIPGVRLIGVGVGDEFAIMPQGAVAVSEAGMIAVATVDGVTSLAAEARVAFRRDHTVIPMGAQAFPLRISTHRWPIVIPGEDAAAQALRDAAGANVLLRPVKSRTDADDVVLAEVAVGDSLAIHDAVGLIAPPAPADPAGIKTTVANLSRMARATNLRALQPAPVEQLTDEFSLDWGRVVESEARPLPNSGGVLCVGERVYFTLRNHGDRNLFFHLFDVGADDAITQILADSPSGERIEPGRELVVGMRNDKLDGIAVDWPEATPKGAPRPETVLLLVTTRPEDLSAFGQGGARNGDKIAGLRESGSSLQKVLATLDSGGSRNFAAVSAGPVVHYAVARIDFDLSPHAAPREETARFIADDRPDRSSALLAARTETNPVTLTVRLKDLVVHEGEMFQASDIRVDTLVVTTLDGIKPVYEARTAQFAQVPEDGHLPMDDMIVYRGQAAGLLDFAWWISRCRTDGRPLGDSLRDEVGQIVPAADWPAVGADIAALLVNTASRVLLTMAEHVAGMYRVSWPDAEHTSSARHPAEGVVRAGAFSFAYAIDVD